MQPKVCYSSDTISKYATHDCEQHGKERGGIKKYWIAKSGLLIVKNDH